MQALQPAADVLLLNNLSYHSFIFYRKNKDLSPITGKVSTIMPIHPFLPKLTPENTRGLSARSIWMPTAKRYKSVLS